MGRVGLEGLTHRLINSFLARVLSSARLLRGGPGSGIAADCMRGGFACVSMKQRQLRGLASSASGVHVSMSLGPTKPSLCTLL